jgi:hypothetical protein
MLCPTFYVRVVPEADIEQAGSQSMRERLRYLVAQLCYNRACRAKWCTLAKRDR